MMRILISLLLLISCSTVQASDKSYYTFTLVKSFSYTDLFKNNLEYHLGLKRSNEQLTIYRDEKGCVTSILWQLRPLSFWDVTPSRLSQELRELDYDKYLEEFNAGKPPNRVYRPDEYNPHEMQQVVNAFVANSIAWADESDSWFLLVSEPLNFHRIEGPLMRKKGVLHITEYIVLPFVYKYPEKTLFNEDYED
jgi:hypothetical protein